ncbi:cell division protein FtsK [Paraliobacillus quinghaiensis]|uniref:Cell division protein FtsK n=2 Tax=Paraliobacillus quinghaiensis TaxID=470815 RepID=A0A917TM46_9BACI|nr:cell division protein FtsK [Paraliobacillus quinghaiensis]
MIWLKRIFVIFISILTFGMYVPPVQITTNAEADSKEVESSKEDSNANQFNVFMQNEQANSLVDTFPVVEPDPVDQLIEQAKMQTVTKMGPKIASQIEEDFTASILPGIEEVIESILDNIGEEKVPYIKISEEQFAGYGEKIFTLYDIRTKQDIARFDVRRDNRPQEGYWFNFHYHVERDNYETHHALGEIYWSKDTPPKWMS